MVEVQSIDEVETATEPPKRWRNWWRLYPPVWVTCNFCGTQHFRDQQARTTPIDYDGCCQVYPSKDLAESGAEPEYDDSCAQARVEYLGAYPEGERPA